MSISLVEVCPACVEICGVSRAFLMQRQAWLCRSGGALWNVPMKWLGYVWGNTVYQIAEKQATHSVSLPLLVCCDILLCQAVA